MDCVVELSTDRGLGLQQHLAVAFNITYIEIITTNGYLHWLMQIRISIGWIECDIIGYNMRSLELGKRTVTRYEMGGGDKRYATTRERLSKGLITFMPLGADLGMREIDVRCSGLWDDEYGCLVE